MIAKLTGRLDSLGADHAVIDVGGVGYLVFCSARTLNSLGSPGNSLGSPGAAVALLVDTHVREDAITLYGFAEAAEREWFRLLITVQGVGARVAQAVLGALGPDDLVRALAAQDRTALIRADGVGPKLAARILSELKDKAGAIALGPAATATTAAVRPVGAVVPDGGARGDAVSALVNLGYGRSEAFATVIAAEASLGERAGVSALIGQALKALGQKGAER